MAEIGKTSKLNQLREDAVGYLEELLADKLEEVQILQKQLALLSKHHVRDANMVDPYGDAGKYTGQVHNEKPHGRGTMNYDDGRVYVGECFRNLVGTGRFKQRYKLLFLFGYAHYNIDFLVHR